jgi:hypothetical protein
MQFHPLSLFQNYYALLQKLLGAGDMLYLGGEMSKPVRLQSAYISESEVKRVVKYLIDEYKDEINDEINLTPTEAGSSAAFDSMMNEDSLEDDDELYEAVREEVINSKKASTSYIQRKFGIGYSRAAKLIDTLEARGVVGPANGSKPRDILVGGESPAEEIPAEENNIANSSHFIRAIFPERELSMSSLYKYHEFKLYYFLLLVFLQLDSHHRRVYL